MAILFPFKPNWKNGFKKTLNYKTEVLVTRDRTEQRLARRAKPRTTFEFTANPVRTEVAQASALFFKDIQGEFIVPEFPLYERNTTDRVAGFDNVVLTDPAPYWAAVGFWIVIETSVGLEAFLVASVSGGTVTIAGTLAGDALTGAKVWPGVLGRLDQASKLAAMTSRAATFNVSFDVDPSNKNYPAQTVPFNDGAISGILRHPATPIGGTTTYYTLAQLGLTEELVETGRVHLQVSVHSTFVNTNNGSDMPGYLSAYAAFYADNGFGAHATLPLPGQAFEDSGDVTGEGTKTLDLLLSPLTKHVSFQPQVLSTIPFYTMATYSVVNTVRWVPETDDVQGYFNGVPTLFIRPNWASPVNLTAIGALERVDYDSGLVENYSYLTWNAVSTQASFMRRDRGEIDRLVQLFNTAKGQQGEFYMPSWLEDFDVAIGAAAGATTLLTPGLTLYQSYAGSEFHNTMVVFYRDGTFQINPVLSIAGAGLNSRTTVHYPWRQAVNSANVYMACWFNRCRFMIDTLTLDYETDSKVTTQLTYKIVKGSPYV